MISLILKEVRTRKWFLQATWLKEQALKPVPTLPRSKDTVVIVEARRRRNSSKKSPCSRPWNRMSTIRLETNRIQIARTKSIDLLIQLSRQVETRKTSRLIVKTVSSRGIGLTGTIRTMGSQIVRNRHNRLPIKSELLK